MDATGVTYTAQISKITKQQTEAIIIATKKEPLPPPYLHLGQAVIKKKNMEFLIQKATELGVSSIQPYISQHCSLTYDPNSQYDRWHKIVMDSCKQCQRSIPPTIRPIVNFSQILTINQNSHKKIFFWENEKTHTLAPFSPTPPTSISILIGPEGGFTEQEVSASCAAGFESTSLGPRILRAETAAITAIAISQYLLDRSAAQGKKP